LILLVGEAQRQAALVEKRAIHGHALVLEQLRNAAPVGFLHGGAVARQLQRVFLAEQVRQRQQDRRQQHDRDQHDLPARIRDHALLTVPFGSTSDT